MQHPTLTHRWFVHRARSRRLGFMHERHWQSLQRLAPPWPLLSAKFAADLAPVKSCAPVRA
jgi:hypothetical protein